MIGLMRCWILMVPRLPKAALHGWMRRGGNRVEWGITAAGMGRIKGVKMTFPNSCCRASIEAYDDLAQLGQLLLGISCTSGATSAVTSGAGSTGEMVTCSGSRRRTAVRYHCCFR